MRNKFFSETEEDENLEAKNTVFWDHLISHINKDCEKQAPRSLLDIGCHNGGLLSRLAGIWRLQRIWGIEPLASARSKAIARLDEQISEVRILNTTEWHQVPGMTFDLVTCHEVFYLEPDLHFLVSNIERVLSRSGRAYIVLGCHAENPVWPIWKSQLQAIGHQVYDHRPMDILAAGARCGLTASLRPLRQTGWITHDPMSSEFTFSNAEMMIDHHFKHKLLFRLARS